MGPPLGPPPHPCNQDDKAAVLKVWAAVGGTKQTLTNGSDDVEDWKGITISNGRVTRIGEKMLMLRLGVGLLNLTRSYIFVERRLGRIQVPPLGSHIEGDREL